MPDRDCLGLVVVAQGVTREQALVDVDTLTFVLVECLREVQLQLLVFIESVVISFHRVGSCASNQWLCVAGMDE